jgi:hypothetical protein
VSCSQFPMWILLPPVHFIWRKLEWHGLLNYTLTIHLLYIILFMLINLLSLDSIIPYISNHIKFVL